MSVDLPTPGVPLSSVNPPPARPASSTAARSSANSSRRPTTRPSRSRTGLLTAYAHRGATPSYGRRCKGIAR